MRYLRGPKEVRSERRNECLLHNRNVFVMTLPHTCRILCRVHISRVSGCLAGLSLYVKSCFLVSH